MTSFVEPEHSGSFSEGELENQTDATLNQKKILAGLELLNQSHQERMLPWSETNSTTRYILVEKEIRIIIGM